MVKKGFSIIEWLISFFLILLILTSVFQSCVVMNKHLLKTSKSAYKCAELCSAFDMVVRYISSAPFQPNVWKKLSRNELIWHDKALHADIGCCIENRNIFIIKGTYVNGAWHKKRRNLIARNIDRFDFYPHYAKKNLLCNIRLVLEAECEGKSYTFERIVYIQNRIV